MPLLPRSSYVPPLFGRGAHLQTIFPTLFRHFALDYSRERIPTADGDFLDLDWSRVGSRQVAILSHGLEGSSHSPYVKGMVRELNREGIDAVCWNFRGCSGEPNLTLRSYHSGETEDYHTVVRHVARPESAYDEIYLVGFSLGGNITLKYLGENRYTVDSRIKRAVTFSVPCDLRSSAHELAKTKNRVYMLRFLRDLRRKIAEKVRRFPGQIDDSDFSSIRSFLDFDNRYTAPMHGFRDADHYWSSCSSRQYISSILVPTLLVSAANDPFLAPPCFPMAEARASSTFFLEVPDEGGHNGFISYECEGSYWSEHRTIEFIKSAK